MNANTTTSSSQNGEQNSGKVPCKKLVNILAVVGVTQQPTTEATCRNEQAAPRSSSLVDASLSIFHPGPYTSTHPEVIVSSELALRTQLQGDCRAVTKSKHMVITRKKKQQQQAVLTPQGTYTAVVKTATFKPQKEGTEGPGTVEVEFTLHELNQHITRVYPAKIEGRSPLLRDSKIILQRGLRPEEEEQGFDPAILVGEACRLHIGHRLDHSGKPHTQTITVMTAESAQAAAAAPAPATTAAEPVAATVA